MRIRSSILAFALVLLGPALASAQCWDCNYETPLCPHCRGFIGGGGQATHCSQPVECVCDLYGGSCGGFALAPGEVAVHGSLAFSETSSEQASETSIQMPMSAPLEFGFTGEGTYRVRSCDRAIVYRSYDRAAAARSRRLLAASENMT